MSVTADVRLYGETSEDGLRGTRLANPHVVSVGDADLLNDDNYALYLNLDSTVPGEEGSSVDLFGTLEDLQELANGILRFVADERLAILAEGAI